MLTSSCVAWNQNKSKGLTAIDDFCVRYQKVIQEKGDSNIQGKLSVKKRIASNEAIYKCQCEGVAAYCFNRS